MKLKILQKNLGFTLSEVLLSTAIIAMSAATVTALVQGSQKVKSNNDGYEAVLKYKAKIVEGLRSSPLMKNIATKNGEPCLAKLGICPNGSNTFKNLIFIDSSNVELTNQGSPNLGFNKDSEPCTSYPSLECPFRFTTEWKGLCVGGACTTATNSQIIVRGTLAVANIPEVARINPAFFGFEITLGQALSSYEESCTSIGGTYSANPSPSCVLPNSQPCPNGQFVVAYDKNSKSVTCKNYTENMLNSQTCPDGQIIFKVINGQPVCYPLLANPWCSGLNDPNCAPYLTQVYQLILASQQPSSGSSSSSSSSSKDGDGGCGP